MSTNDYRPHLLVLPEDDANRQIANGFLVEPELLNSRAIHVLPEAGGWESVLEVFRRDYVSSIRKYPERRIVLLIDFDGDFGSRKQHVDANIPTDIKERVFVLGVASEPEVLRSQSGKKFEVIGAALANDCVNNRKDFWNHPLLKHNELELDRLNRDVRPFLFGV
jgi:hypothetical protein